MIEAEKAIRDANRFTVSIPTGGGAVWTITNPMADPHIEWMLRYAPNLTTPSAGRFSAASLVESYDYLLSSNINMTEATRILRLLRAARRAAIDAAIDSAKLAKEQS